MTNEDAATKVAEIMRVVDAYAYDYKAQGKMAPSRREVERALFSALGANLPPTQADEDADWIRAW